MSDFYIELSDDQVIYRLSTLPPIKEWQLSEEKNRTMIPDKTVKING